MDPDTGVHTQNIESHWRALKMRITPGGIRKEYLYDHFGEHIFMKEHANNIFGAMVKEIVKQYE